jgi:hypothetical protein
LHSNEQVLLLHDAALFAGWGQTVQLGPHAAALSFAVHTSLQSLKPSTQLQVCAAKSHSSLALHCWLVAHPGLHSLSARSQ